MKNTCSYLYDENVLERKNDTYLDDVIKDYYKVCKDSPNDKDAIFDALNRIFKVMEYRPLILPKEMLMKVNPEDLKKPKKKKDIPVVNLEDETSNGNIVFDPLYLSATSIDTNEQLKILVILSSLNKKDVTKPLGIVKMCSMDFKEIYEKYILTGEANGISLNPMIDGIQITKEVGEYIYNGCKEEDWLKFVEKYK